MPGAISDLLDYGPVGRARELAAGRRLLGAEEGVAALFFHGPGGIGKTTVLAALAGEAEDGGRPVWWLDGRELPPGQEPLEDLVAEAASAERPLVVVDSFELVASRGDFLRRELLPSLPSGSALLVAGRSAPSPEWFEEQGPTTRDIRLGPLSDVEARELLAGHGVEDGLADRLVAWGRGHPLALGLAARLTAQGEEWLPGEGEAPEELARAVVRRLGETDFGAARLPTLGVAAIARSTTPALLEAALPEHDATAEWEWLAGRAFVEPVGEGIALHALLRDAVRELLRRRGPNLERNLKRRIADHLYAAAEASGELNRAVDLSHLIEDPRLRWGFAWEASARWYVDAPRRGDGEEIERRVAEEAPDMEGAWRATRSLFERMPELGAVVRDDRGAIRGFTFLPTTAVDDAELEASPVLGPPLRHARARVPRGEGVLMPYICDLTGEPLSGMVGMLANAALLRASRSNPRYVYMTIRENVEAGQEFARRAGAERVPELDLERGGARVLCWAIDFGPGGFLANQRELVYRELNLEPPVRPPEDGGAEIAEQVRDALRGLGSPVELAASPLAEGEGVEERAASARRLLADAADGAFGPDPDERLLREVLLRGYLDPEAGHESAAAALYLSRSTYFRRLRQAVDRVAEYVAADRPAGLDG